MLSKQKDVNAKKIWQVIDSDFVPLYNPIREYLNRLPPWDETTNPILDLALSVNVKGGPDEQLLFYACLRKWLVGMVAGWLEENKVNEEILVLIGEQGIYKTQWFEHLLPPELSAYFNSTSSFGKMDKDEVLSLSQFGLICLDEIDALKSEAMSRLKWAVTTKTTDARKPYAHNSERRIHIASYCGTSNNLQFIDDDSGTRRWLTFEVESIRSPLEYPIHHEEIFAQAYRLYLSGFRYWFEGKESDIVQLHNKRFEVPKPEQDLVGKYYRAPAKDEPCVFVSSSEIMQTIGGLLINRLTPNKLGRVMKDMGFKRVRSRGERGYNVVAYSGAEITLNRSLMAKEAKPEDEVSAVSHEVLLDAFDTLF
jgi:predicted P-loop ATPase